MSPRLFILIAAVALPCAAQQSQAERLAAAELEIAAALCSEWRPGTGLTRTVVGDKVVLSGWVHSIIPGRHVLHGGAVKFFGKDTNEFVQQAGNGRARTLYSHYLRVEMAPGATLKWTRPDGVTEVIPTQNLYPKK